jgi:hypothetical protein
MRKRAGWRRRGFNSLRPAARRGAGWEYVWLSAAKKPPQGDHLTAATEKNDYDILRDQIGKRNRHAGLHQRWVGVMRARNIKPGFFKNEILGTMDPLAQLLFAGLWCMADKAGRLKDIPVRIRAEIFPYRESLDVNGYLTVLQRSGFITRYEVAGERFIEIHNFNKHQHCHHTEKASTLPGAPTNQAVSDSNGDLTVKPPLDNGYTPSDLLKSDLLKSERLKEEARAAKAASPKSTSRKLAKAPPNPDLKKAIDLYARCWEVNHSIKPTFQGKDAKAVETVLKAAGNNLQRFRAILDAYFADADSFVSEKQCHSATYLASNVNKYLAIANAEISKRPTYDEYLKLTEQLNGQVGKAATP